MHRIAAAFTLVLVIFVLPVPETVAQDPPRGPAETGIVLEGAGIDAMTLTPDRLAGFPAVEEDVVFMSGRGERRGLYRGVLLWTIFEEAGLLRGAEGHAELGRTFLVTARDGLAVAFSVGEIAPDFGNTPIMLALEVDGSPLRADEGLRLIVPGDARGARNVRDVVRIEIR